MKNKIAAIVVTYNRKKLLRECIDRLLKQNYSELDIIVIDNASTDNTKDEIINLIEENKIIYVNTGENLGGAGGFNYGIKEAYRRGYEYYWLMDDDTMTNESALKEFLEADRSLKGDWGFLSSAVYWLNGDTCKMNKQTIDKNWTDDIKLINEGIIKVKEATFVSCFIKKEVVEKIGLPIKEFIIWNDDREFTDRISSQYKCYLVSKSSVIHKINNNIETDIENDSFDRMWRYKYVFRNGLYFMKRKGWKSVIRYHIKIIYRVKRVLVSSCDKKTSRIGIIIASLISGYFFNP